MEIASTTMQHTDIELSKAVMALRAIVYQAEHQLKFLTQIASQKDAADQADLEYLHNCLNAINPAISWLDEQVFEKKRIALGQPSQPLDV
ncbi:MAG: hypothetical protein ACKO24_05265 [Leptolyngbyaceae cyanobacterium]